MTDTPDHVVPFIGLTGGMGSGKSTALALLGELGCLTTSADEIVHDLYRGEPLRGIVTERWGSGVIAADGAVDRDAIARQVFGDPAEREWLQAQVWPLVGQRIWEFRLAADAAARAGKAPRAAVVETPLLFEAGMDAAYDTTIAVIAPEALRAERAAARGHAAVDERNAAQLPQDEKAARAGHVVVNDGDLAQLRQRLAGVLDAIVAAA